MQKIRERFVPALAQNCSFTVVHVTQSRHFRLRHSFVCGLVIYDIDPDQISLPPLQSTAPNHRFPLDTVIMAATAKYQAAPSRDSFDEEQYTQAPPSYQDNPSGSSAPEVVGGYGTPRQEDDNVPDDFKVR